MYRGLIVSLSMVALSFTQIEYTIPIRYSQVDTKALEKRYETPSTTNLIITTKDIIQTQHIIITNSILLKEAQKQEATTQGR